MKEIKLELLEEKSVMAYLMMGKETSETELTGKGSIKAEVTPASPSPFITSSSPATTQLTPPVVLSFTSTSPSNSVASRPSTLAATPATPARRDYKFVMEKQSDGVRRSVKRIVPLPRLPGSLPLRRNRPSPSPSASPAPEYLPNGLLRSSSTVSLIPLRAKRTERQQRDGATFSLESLEATSEPDWQVGRDDDGNFIIKQKEGKGKSVELSTPTKAAQLSSTTIRIQSKGNRVVKGNNGNKGNNQGDSTASGSGGSKRAAAEDKNLDRLGKKLKPSHAGSRTSSRLACSSDSTSTSGTAATPATTLRATPISNSAIAAIVCPFTPPTAPAAAAIVTPTPTLADTTPLTTETLELSDSDDEVEIVTPRSKRVHHMRTPPLTHSPPQVDPVITSSFLTTFLAATKLADHYDLFIFLGIDNQEEFDRIASLDPSMLEEYLVEIQDKSSSRAEENVGKRLSQLDLFILKRKLSERSKLISTSSSS
jgi:hypothetical protein